MKIKFVIGISVVLGLSLPSCAVAPKLKKSELSDVESGKSGAIVFGMETDGFKCGLINLSFAKVGGGHAKSLTITNTRSKPVSIAVPPGDYVLTNGGCIQDKLPRGDWQDFTRYSFPELRTAFVPISVAAGEVVYVGTLQVKKLVDMSKFPTKMTLKLAVLGLDQNKISVVDYQVKNEIAKHQAGLAETSPELVANMQPRLAQVASGYMPLPVIWVDDSKRVYKPKVVKPIDKKDLPNKTHIKERVERTYTKPPSPPVRPEPRERPTRPTFTPPPRPVRPKRPTPRPPPRPPGK